MRPLHTFVLATLLLVSFVMLLMPAAAAHPVDLGSAADFAILTGSGITNIGHSTVSGDVGSYPTATQTGFDGPANTVTLVPPSVNHGGDDVTRVAKDDLVTAYVEARDRPDAAPVGSLAGLTLVAGVYADNNAPDSMANTGTLTLDGQGVPSGVFIFQSGSTLTFGPGSRVVLTNGAQACNVFWQVTSSATLGTTSHVEGTILALTSVSLNQGAAVNGRVLAINGAVTMEANTIQNVPCAPANTTTSSSSTTSPATTTATSATSTSATSSTGTSGTGSTTTSATSTVTGSATSSPSGTSATSSTGTSTSTGSGTQTGTGTNPGTTTTDPVTGATTGTTTPAIPFFPTTVAIAGAAIAALAGAVLVLRRRRP